MKKKIHTYSSRQATRETTDGDGKSFVFPPARLFVFFCFFYKPVYKKKWKLHTGGWTATEEAVTDSDCTGDGRQQQSLCYRFFN